MAFLSVANPSPLRFNIFRVASILATKTKLVFLRRPIDAQHAMDAQIRREAARRDVDNLLR